MPNDALAQLARQLSFGSLLEAVITKHRGYDIVAHWKQGEFHHDLVVRVHERGRLPGQVLVVATNCNGGVKELLCFEEVPDRFALWHTRCPDNPEFEGELAPVLAEIRTLHWFDPCALLEANTRSELKPECRRRQRGGGYEPLL
ncbi:MAG: hypothetical protein QM778_38640 [Myxococcales bacterium]